MPRVPTRMVAIDLDGTLLNSQYQLSEEVRITVGRLSQRGVRVILASGRMHRTIRPFGEKIGLNDPIISYNGALVKDIQTDRTLYHQPIPWLIASDLIDWAVQRELHLNFYVDDLLYVRDDNQWSQLYAERTGAMPQVIEDLHRLTGQDPTKMLVVDAPAQVKRIEPELDEWSDGRLLVMRTQPEYIELMNPEVSKGRALLALAEQFGIERDEVAVLGDGPNDQSMMEVAGFSVAMGNAPESIQQQADYITASNDEHGVAQAIEELLL